MSHPYQFCLDIIKLVIEQDVGIREVAKLHHIPHSVVIHWLKAFRERGLDGVKSPYKKPQRFSKLRTVIPCTLCAACRKSLIKVERSGYGCDTITSVLLLSVCAFNVIGIALANTKTAPAFNKVRRFILLLLLFFIQSIVMGS